MRAQASGQVKDCERFLKLQERLPRLLTGEDKPNSAQESLDVAQVCRHKKMYASAARLAAEALAADPKLGDDLSVAHRYSAACYAALAAAGAGKGEPPPDDAARATLRGQAFEWLRADLALWGKQLDGGQPADRAAVQRTLRQWQQDPDLAAIRDKDSLAKLSGEEQKSSTQLWVDVAALLTKAETPAAKAPEK